MIYACLAVWHMSGMHKVEAKEHERAVEAMGHKLGMKTMAYEQVSGGTAT